MEVSTRPEREFQRGFCMHLELLGAVVVAVGKLADLGIILEIGGSPWVFFVHML
jgi:hypothetical protein